MSKQKIRTIKFKNVMSDKCVNGHSMGEEKVFVTFISNIYIDYLYTMQVKIKAKLSISFYFSI